MNRYAKIEGRVQIGAYSYPIGISGMGTELTDPLNPELYLKTHGSIFHLDPGDKFHISWTSGEMHIQVQHHLGGTTLYIAKI